MPRHSRFPTGERTGSLRTQSARHRVNHGTICGRSCANWGHYKPLCACVDRSFVNRNSSRRRPEKICTPADLAVPDEVHAAVDGTASSRAYAQLMDVAAKMREKSPELTVEQAFSRAFQDPKNAALAAAAHNRPAPSDYMAWPKFSTPPSQPKRV
jgi:hypothetical protein